MSDDLELLGAVDRSNRIGKTGIQVGIPSALVGIGTWFAALAHVDLDPGAGVDMPAEIVAAWIFLVTAALAWSMNRRPKSAPETGMVDIAERLAPYIADPTTGASA